MPSDLSYTQRRSRFVYGTPGNQVSFTTELPVRPWGRRTSTVGGRLKSATGVPASYVVHRGHVLNVPVRLRESEWEAMEDLIAWGQLSESFLWYPDALEPNEFYAVYLETPVAGEDVEPDRNSDYPKLMEITLGLRTLSGNPWRKEFFNYEALDADNPILGLPIYLPSNGSRGEPATDLAGTYMDIGIRHQGSDGTETVEVWMLRDGTTSWFLAASAAVTASPTQVVRTTIPLLENTTHDIALRYRRGTLYNPGAVFGTGGAPAATWPSLSRGQEVSEFDPATLDSAVWSRTAADAERVRLTISPQDAAEDILVWRRPGTSGTWVLLTTLVGPHGASETHDDTTIDGESTYQYSVSTGDGARGPALTVYTGPVGVPTFLWEVPFGAGYQVGFEPQNASYHTQLEDAYDDAGSVEAMSLRATTDNPGDTEIFSGVLSNVPSPEFSFPARLRHVVTSFGVDDFGEYGPEFTVTVPESE